MEDLRQQHSNDISHIHDTFLKQTGETENIMKEKWKQELNNLKTTHQTQVRLLHEEKATLQTQLHEVI